MRLRDELLKPYSKEREASIVEQVGDDAGRFAELLSLMTSPEYRVSQRASGPVSKCVERHPHLITPHYDLLLTQLQREGAHPSVRRNVVRLLQFVEIPERCAGGVFDACWRLVDDPHEAIAVRTFALTVASNIAKVSPDLLEELKLLAVKYPQAASAAFRSRASRILGV